MLNKINLNRLKCILSTFILIFNLLIEFYLVGYYISFSIPFFYLFIFRFSLMSIINLVTHLSVAFFITYIVYNVNKNILNSRFSKEYNIISVIVFILFSIAQFSLFPTNNNVKFYTIKYNEKTITGQKIERNYFICNNGENNLKKMYSIGDLVTDFEKKESEISEIELNEYFYSFKPFVLLEISYLNDDLYLNNEIFIKSRNNLKHYFDSLNDSYVLKLIFVPQLIFEFLYFSVINFIFPVSFIITLIVFILKYKIKSFKPNLTLTTSGFIFFIGIIILLFVFNYISNLEIQF